MYLEKTGKRASKKGGETRRERLKSLGGLGLRAAGTVYHLKKGYSRVERHGFKRRLKRPEAVTNSFIEIIKRGGERDTESSGERKKGKGGHVV